MQKFACIEQWSPIHALNQHDMQSRSNIFQNFHTGPPCAESCGDCWRSKGKKLQPIQWERQCCFCHNPMGDIWFWGWKFECSISYGFINKNNPRLGTIWVACNPPLLPFVWLLKKRLCTSFFWLLGVGSEKAFIVTWS